MEMKITAKWYYRGDIDEFINENYEDERDYWQQYYEELLTKEFENTYTGEDFYEIEDELKEDLLDFYEITINNITKDYISGDGTEVQMTSQYYENTDFELSICVKYTE